MRYLTSKSSPTEILKDPMIANNKELLFESLNAQDTVDFNDKTTRGDQDNATPFVISVALLWLHGGIQK
jgi:hypothetical protein